MEETRQPQDHLGITGLEALANTGSQRLPCQSHKTFHSSQYARHQYALESMGKWSSHEQVQVQMTFPKEAKGNSQDSGHSTAPEAMVKFGQMSTPSQSLAISLFTQDARTQDAPEAMANFLPMNKCKNRRPVPRRQRENLKIQATVLRQSLWSNLGRRFLIPQP
jgi:hypothetical protein